MIRYRKDMYTEDCDNCHEGVGRLALHVVLDGKEQTDITFMHDDILEPGVTIGEHLHEGSAEIYFVADGEGIMIVDGKEYPISNGDVSWCNSGHSHGIKNSTKSAMRLLVIGLTK
jgi:mannose-6-phosphate isomerase-like protein (cupin superfamily)